MKHFKHHRLAILPLLSILAMSPGMVEKNFHSGRVIASVQEEVKGHPRYEAATQKVKTEETKDLEITKEKLQEKLGEVKLKLDKEREEFKKDQTDEVVVTEQRKSVESLVAEVLLVDGSLKQLEEKKLIEAEELKANQDVLLKSKDIVESLLADLESNEVLVVKAKEPKVEEPKVEEEKPVIVAEEPKKEDEPKKEEPKKEEEKPVIVADEPKKEEPKKEEEKPVIVADEPKKEEPKKEVCEADEKNKVLTSQVEELMKQNNQILQAMLGMSQMMVSMYQNMQQQQPQQNPFYANGPGWNQSPYQYNQPQTAGNWVYYPNGFQPQQPNIFAQPQMMPQYQMPMQQSIYPDQMHMQQPMQQSQWMLNSDPRYTIQNSFTPGSFGNDNGAFSFNMGQAPVAQAPMMNQSPVLSQAPVAPIMGQAQTFRPF